MKITILWHSRQCQHTSPCEVEIAVDVHAIAGGVESWGPSLPPQSVLERGKDGEMKKRQERHTRMRKTQENIWKNT